MRLLMACLCSFIAQVGVQTEVEQDAGVNALEEKVNEVHPLLHKDDDDDDDDGGESS